MEVGSNQAVVKFLLTSLTNMTQIKKLGQENFKDVFGV